MFGIYSSNKPVLYYEKQVYLWKFMFRLVILLRKLCIFHVKLGILRIEFCRNTNSV